MRVDPAGTTNGSTVVDLALVGVGGAGLTVLHALALAAPSSGRIWQVALVDDVDRLATRPDDRTWCFWDRGRNPADPALTAAWTRMAVVSPSSHQVLDLTGLRYAMLRAPGYYALVDGAVRDAGPSLQVRRLPAATSVEDGEPLARVRTSGGDVAARWVLDSRPAAPARTGVTTLRQQFRGAVVRTEADVFDPELPVLMDFRTPQPVRGLSFGYCLPLDRRRALVEYTEFSPAAWDDDTAAAALDSYLASTTGTAYEVEHVEQGVIPMSDAPMRRRAGRRVLRTGTAGGATRPATGYTFRAMQRQADAIVSALLAGRDPVPPRAYPARHAVMDAALLRALDRGYVDGPDFFTRLFARNPAPRVLDFLDGASHPASEVALMATSPAWPMLRGAAESLLLAAARTAVDWRRAALQR